MKALLHPIIFYRVTRYHLSSGLTLANAMNSAYLNLNRGVSL